MASGYLNLPKWIIEDLKSCKDLDILCASPNVSSIKANGFLGDGIKNYIPLMYRWIE